MNSIAMHGSKEKEEEERRSRETEAGIERWVFNFGLLMHHELRFALNLKEEDNLAVLKDEYGGGQAHEEDVLNPIGTTRYRPETVLAIRTARDFLDELVQSYASGTPGQPSTKSMYLRGDDAPYDLDTKIRQWVAIHSFQLPTRCFHLDLESFEVALHPSVLWRILHNLTANARQALDATEITSDQWRCIIRIARAGGAFTMDVLDNGAPLGASGAGVSFHLGIELVHRYVVRGYGGSMETNFRSPDGLKGVRLTLPVGRRG